jgi:hypothetical protein
VELGVRRKRDDCEEKKKKKNKDKTGERSRSIEGDGEGGGGSGRGRKTARTGRAATAVEKAARKRVDEE